MFVNREDHSLRCVMIILIFDNHSSSNSNDNDNRGSDLWPPMAYFLVGYDRRV